MKTLLTLLLSCVSVFGSPLSVIGYNGTTAQSPIKQGTMEIILVNRGFQGTVGNINFSSASNLVIPIYARQNGDRLNDLSYTVSTPTMSLLEVR